MTKEEEKWEEILKNCRLSMHRGQSKKLVYGHDFNRTPDDVKRCGGGSRVEPHPTLGQMDKDGFSS